MGRGYIYEENYPGISPSRKKKKLHMHQSSIDCLDWISRARFTPLLSPTHPQRNYLSGFSVSEEKREEG